MTSIPSRFKFLPAIVAQLLKLHPDCAVYVCIPDIYTRFPDIHFDIPDFSVLGNRVKILRGKDYGPATKFIAPALVVPDDETIVYVDDDTSYPPTLVSSLTSFPGVCGLSGFNFQEYFKGSVSRGHLKKVDVIEGYGGVSIQAKIIKNNLSELLSLLELTYNDDLALSNLLEKIGVSKKTIMLPECNLGHVKQYQYGFGTDALHYNNGEGTHINNNKRILNIFSENSCNYFK